MVMMSTLSDRLRKKRFGLFGRSVSDLDSRSVNEWQFLHFNDSSKPTASSPAPPSAERRTHSTLVNFGDEAKRSAASAAAAAEAHRRLVTRKNSNRSSPLFLRMSQRAVSSMGLFPAPGADANSSSSSTWLTPAPLSQQSNSRHNSDLSAQESDDGTDTVLRRRSAGHIGARPRPASMTDMLSVQKRSMSGDLTTAGMNMIKRYSLEHLIEAPDEEVEPSGVENSPASGKQAIDSSANSTPLRRERFPAVRYKNRLSFTEPQPVDVKQQKPTVKDTAKTKKQQKQQNGFRFSSNKDKTSLKNEMAAAKKPAPCDSANKLKQKKNKGKGRETVRNPGSASDVGKGGGRGKSSDRLSTCSMPDVVRCSPLARGERHSAGADYPISFSDSLAGNGDTSAVAGGISRKSLHAINPAAPLMEEPLAHTSSNNNKSNNSRDNDDEVDDLVGGAGDACSGGVKQNTVTIGRSESCHQVRDRKHRRRIPREKRKHSDPNISSTSDADGDVTRRLSSNAHSHSSSNSSLSNRLDSPSTSMDSVVATAAAAVGSSSSSRLSQASVQMSPSVQAAAARAAAAAAAFGEGCDGWDSDLEVGADAPPWQNLLRLVCAGTGTGSSGGSSHGTIPKLSKKASKRLQVINELFHTEQTHVRNLKVLVHVFYRPLLNSNILRPDDVNLLFSNVEDMLQMHSQFNDSMKRRRNDPRLLDNVGDILVQMFEGENGENFRTGAAAFCRCQSSALDRLKAISKRDQNFAQFLAAAEANPVCRRLQLKDFLPMVMQRLTKYPMLLKLWLTLVDNEEERALGERAYQSSCQVLDHVNEVKGETERHERLVEMHSKMDQNLFMRATDPIVEILGGSLDLTKYHLVHECSVELKVRQKSRSLYVLLLREGLIVLLHQQQDKYILKPISANNTEMMPVVCSDKIYARINAAQPRSVIIMDHSQCYELQFGTVSETNEWLSRMMSTTTKGVDSKAPHVSVSSERSPSGHTRTGSTSSVLTGAVESVTAAAAAPATAGSFSEQRHQQKREEPQQQQQQQETEHKHHQRQRKQPQQEEQQQQEEEQQQRLEEQQQQQSGRGPPQCGDKDELSADGSLIPPTEVTVRQSVVLTAERVVCPIERLRCIDTQVSRALERKLTLLSAAIDPSASESTSSSTTNTTAAAAVSSFAQVDRTAPDTAYTDGDGGGEGDGRETAANDYTVVDYKRATHIAADTAQRCVALLNSVLTDTAASTVSWTRQQLQQQLAPLLQMHEHLSCALTQMAGSVTSHVTLLQQLQTMCQRVRQLERQLAHTAAASDAGGEKQQQQQQRRQLMSDLIDLSLESVQDDVVGQCADNSTDMTAASQQTTAAAAAAGATVAAAAAEVTAVVEVDEVTAVAEADEVTAVEEVDEVTAVAEADEVTAVAEADGVTAVAEADEVTAVEEAVEEADEVTAVAEADQDGDRREEPAESQPLITDSDAEEIETYLHKCGEMFFDAESDSQEISTAPHPDLRDNQQRQQQQQQQEKQQQQQQQHEEADSVANGCEVAALSVEACAASVAAAAVAVASASTTTDTDTSADGPAVDGQLLLLLPEASPVDAGAAQLPGVDSHVVVQDIAEPCSDQSEMVGEPANSQPVHEQHEDAVGNAVGEDDVRDHDDPGGSFDLSVTTINQVVSSAKVAEPAG